jgi:cytochrome b6-f complex iron-sulfur subunit
MSHPMSPLAVSASVFAVGIVALLFLVFVALLLGSFVRARRAAPRPAAAGGPSRAAGLGRPAVPAAAAAAPAGPTPRRVVSRRDFFRGGLLASLAVFGAQFGGATLAMLWPNLKGGFGSLITLPDSVDVIKSQISSSRQPYYFGAGRFYIVNYDALGGTGATTTYSGLVTEGLMALYQKCAHLGCRVPFCQQSQWFECPCHGSKYNEAGEYELGPAPQGMYRFAVKITGGQVQVDTSTVVLGPPRGTDTIHQSPEGPFCV